MSVNQDLEKLPGAFVWRRLHSLTGFWLVLFLIEHLLVNSQAALLFGESGRGFVRMVNAIHNLPYLQVVEIALLGIPFAIHMIWGVKYLFTGKFHSLPTDGSKPHMNYGRNHAYTWQRITSWILLFLLIFHVVKFRFIDYPSAIDVGGREPVYYLKITRDGGVDSVAARLGATLYAGSGRCTPSSQMSRDSEQLTRTFSKIPLKENELIVAAPNFGTVSLFAVRDAFKNPFYVGLYTVFVLSACFHAFNGFWTFLITWGWILNMTSQKRMVKVSVAIMFLIAFLGLASVWGTYFINLKN